MRKNMRVRMGATFLKFTVFYSKISMENMVASTLRPGKQLHGIETL